MVVSDFLVLKDLFSEGFGECLNVISLTGIDHQVCKRQDIGHVHGSGDEVEDVCVDGDAVVFSEDFPECFLDISISMHFFLLAIFKQDLHGDGSTFWEEKDAWADCV